jgi:hypothetical protein
MGAVDPWLLIAAILIVNLAKSKIVPYKALKLEAEKLTT